MLKPIATVFALTCTLTAPALAAAQTLDLSSAFAPTFAQAPPTMPTIRVPTVVVVAQKEPADSQTLPVSVTAVSTDTIDSAGLTFVSDAAMFAPNTFYSDLFARKVSNARFRGIGASPQNPAITTNIDGVPQLSSNTSNIELLDVEQIEFVRGAQSALFGRNTVGGVVNVVTRRPSLSDWRGSLTVPFGNFGSYATRGAFAGPLVPGKVGGGFSFGWGEREGFTRNVLTDNDIDYRSSFSAKGQVLWTPTSAWETRVIVSGERTRDGDYPLGDLASIRQNPFETARDFEGHTDRDILSTAIAVRGEGSGLAFSSTTGIVDWDTRDVTDLDYTPLSLVVRDNAENARQFTQEFRLASAPNAPTRLGDSIALTWVTGVSFFTQDYDQDVVNTISPFVFSPFVDFAIDQTSTATLEDSGYGVFGSVTATFANRLDVTAGVRGDREEKSAVLNSFFNPPVTGGNAVDEDRTFSNVSPHVAVAFRPDSTQTLYFSAARGFKAGGFNPAAPPGLEVYEEEGAWHYEGGIKALWAAGKLATNVAVFSIDWNDLQLNLPLGPGQFYIANAGDARSRGVEVELNARPNGNVGIFGAFGYTNARFKSGTMLAGADIGDNFLPNAPEYTASVGTELARSINPAASIYGRADVVLYGAFKYDDLNTQGQDAYTLTHFRAGVRGKLLFAEVWLRNAFDQRYVPVAFPYPDFAPSGFVGEPGQPRTFGVTGGVTF